MKHQGPYDPRQHTPRPTLFEVCYAFMPAVLAAVFYVSGLWLSALMPPRSPLFWPWLFMWCNGSMLSGFALGHHFGLMRDVWRRRKGYKP